MLSRSWEGINYYWSHGCSSVVLEQVLSVLNPSPWLRPYLSISAKWKYSPMSHIALFSSQSNLLELQARNAEMCSVSNEALWTTARAMTAQHLWNLYEIYMKSMISNRNACGAQVLVPRSHHRRSGREEQGQKHVAHPQPRGHPTVDSPWLCGFQTMPFASYKSPSHYHQWVMIETYRNHQSHGGWFMPMDDHVWPPRGCHESRLMVTQAQEV